MFPRNAASFESRISKSHAGTKFRPYGSLRRRHFQPNHRQNDVLPMVVVASLHPGPAFMGAGSTGAASRAETSVGQQSAAAAAGAVLAPSRQAAWRRVVGAAAVSVTVRSSPSTSAAVTAGSSCWLSTAVAAATLPAIHRHVCSSQGVAARSTPAGQHTGWPGLCAQLGWAGGPSVRS